jgi:hypothetical protein
MGKKRKEKKRKKGTKSIAFETIERKKGFGN